MPQTEDAWLPYSHTSEDVGAEILDDLNPDHVYYVLEE